MGACTTGAAIRPVARAACARPSEGAGCGKSGWSLVLVLGALDHDLSDDVAEERAADDPPQTFDFQAPAARHHEQAGGDADYQAEEDYDYFADFVHAESFMCAIRMRGNFSLNLATHRPTDCLCLPNPAASWASLMGRRWARKTQQTTAALIWRPSVFFMPSCQIHSTRRVMTLHAPAISSSECSGSGGWDSRRSMAS